MKKEISIYKKVYKKSNLWSAWQVVRANGRLSTSEETQKNIRLFDDNSLTGINDIAKRLSQNTYVFDQSIGVPIRRDGKKSRPIVIASIKNRIVQRSILDIIQKQSQLETVFDHPSSYGGIAKKGVKDATMRVHDLVKSGKAPYFIASDISGFFTAINRSKVLEIVSNYIKDEKFLKLFENALVTELSNLAQLKAEASLFPIHSTGVAQGCCLSPLVGNIYLNEFDKVMNTEDVCCLRYIDDFIILGPSKKIVEAKFRQAQKILKLLGLEAYDPNTDNDKASKGFTRNGIEYLGCYITPNTIRPNDRSWKRLKESVTENFDLALRNAQNADKAYKEKQTFPQVIYANKRKMEGWIKQYSFCNDHRIFSHWNKSLRDIFLEFENNYLKLLVGQDFRDRAILLGFEDIELSLRVLYEKKSSKSKT